MLVVQGAHSNVQVIVHLFPVGVELDDPARAIVLSAPTYGGRELHDGVAQVLDVREVAVLECNFSNSVDQSLSAEELEGLQARNVRLELPGHVTLNVDVVVVVLRAEHRDQSPVGPPTRSVSRLVCLPPAVLQLEAGFDNPGEAVVDDELSDISVFSFGSLLAPPCQQLSGPENKSLLSPGPGGESSVKIIIRKIPTWAITSF